MPLSPDDLRLIAARASLIPERFSHRYEPDPQGDPTRGEARRQRWGRITAAGDETALHTRLSWDGWDDPNPRGRLSGVRLTTDAEVPTWIHTLAALVDAVEQPTAARTDVPSFIHPHRAVPFQAVIVPFVQWAVIRLQEQCGPTWHHLTPPAQGALAHALLQQLASLMEGCLSVALTWARPARPGADVDPIALHDGFARSLLSGGMAPFFRTFSVLGRLVARSVEQWIETAILFLSRLDHDMPAIASAFGGEPGAVIALHPYLSDRHNGGCAVHRLRFASGLDLAYKPKPVDADVIYGDLVAWLQEQTPPLPLRTPQTLARDGYGWQSWVATAPCETPDERRRLCQRTGMLIVLLHALGGVDFGADNIVVAGEHPIPVDMETLLHPVRHTTDGQEPDAEARQRWSQSVWRTGILPDGPLLPTEKPAANVSFVGNLPANLLTDHSDDILAGMQVMQTGLSQWHTALGDYVRRLAQVPLRVIPRPTPVYTTLLAHVLQPAYLQDGADFSIGVEALVSGIETRDGPPDTWPLVTWERAALSDLDIPFLPLNASSTDLTLPTGTTIAGFFGTSGLDQALARLADQTQATAEQNLAIARSILMGGQDRPNRGISTF